MSGPRGVGDPHRAARLAPLVAASGLDARGSGARGTAPEYRFEAERTIQAMAETLARLHTVEVPAELQGDRSLVADPAELVERASSGTATPGPAYRHLSRERLLQILLEGVPSPLPPGELVLSHGHPSFELLRFDGVAAIGFEDWSGLALADPHQDLASVARDLVASFGPAPIHAFFEHYGAALAQPLRPDPVRLDWYLLAHELGS